MRKILKNIPYILCGGILLWGFLSMCEVVAHNMEPDYQYSKANAFGILMEIGDMIHDR